MKRKIRMLVISVTLIVVWFGATMATSARPKLGLDLQGGISIVLFPVEGSDLDTLDAARDVIDNRVNSLGVSDPEVTRQGNTIVVDLAGVDDREQAKDLVGTTAELNFRLVNNQLGADQKVPEPPSSTTATTPTTPTTAAGGSTSSSGSTAPPDGSSSSSAPQTSTTTAATTPTSGDASSPGVEFEPIAFVRPAQESTTVPTESTVTAGIDPAPDQSTTSTIATDASSTTVGGDSTTSAPTTTTTVAAGSQCGELVKASEADPLADNAWVWDRKLDGPHESCFQLGPVLLSGERVSTAKYEFGSDSCGGGSGSSVHCVSVTFKGEDFVEKVATPNVGRQVAIALDNEVVSAPTINQGITGRTVQITGDFSEGEARDLAQLLKYGSLPVKFDERQTVISNVSPSLGKDQLRAGIISGLIGLALVALYMIVYYRLLGLVVWFGLGLTGLIMFSLVSLLGDQQGLTLTLSGVTGLIVSVGVTVDSYVVYFERLKDEVRSGKTIRSSLDTGFRKAFRTIVAADLVSLIGAGVLWALAIGSVKGFAFFLMLSTIVDLVIAYFVMHPLVSIMARRESLVRMKGIGIATGLDVAAEGAV